MEPRHSPVLKRIIQASYLKHIAKQCYKGRQVNEVSKIRKTDRIHFLKSGDAAEPYFFVKTSKNKNNTKYHPQNEESDHPKKFSQGSRNEEKYLRKAQFEMTSKLCVDYT